MVRNINQSFDEETFQRIQAIKEANGGSWEQNIEEAFEVLAESKNLDP